MNQQHIITEVEQWEIDELTEAATGRDHSMSEQTSAIVEIWSRANEAYRDPQLCRDWQPALEAAQDVLADISNAQHPIIAAVLESALEAIDNVLQTTRFDPYYNQD